MTAAPRTRTPARTAPALHRPGTTQRPAVLAPRIAVAPGARVQAAALAAAYAAMLADPIRKAPTAAPQP